MPDIKKFDYVPKQFVLPNKKTSDKSVEVNEFGANSNDEYIDLNLGNDNEYTVDIDKIQNDLYDNYIYNGNPPSNVDGWLDNVLLQKKDTYDDDDFKLMECLVNHGIYLTFGDIVSYDYDPEFEEFYVYLKNGNEINASLYNESFYLSVGDYSFCLENGKLSSIFNFDMRDVDFDFLFDNNKIDVDIFGDYALKTNQYGGNQGIFVDDAFSLLKDEKIINMIKEYFPNATMEDCELYLKKICNVGCGYVALVNTLFKEYQGREEEFEKVFGFPMYDIDEFGIMYYNYEYLVLDYYNYVWRNSGYTIKELYSSHGGFIAEEFVEFLKDKYNVDCNIGNYSEFNLSDMFNKPFRDIDALEIYNKLSSENESIIFCASGFDLYYPDGSLFADNIGGHAMLVTGITDSGDLIVSSWGMQFFVDLDSIDVSSIETGEDYSFIVVNYN